jgi:coenzyme F420-dependent glucose-6-phosphate dehydrogenase
MPMTISMPTTIAMPMTIGFHCSHEQHAPSALLRLARQAEDAGFTAAMCSDHFHPWSERQGHSGFTWSWLGSALEATRLSFGTVCAPGARYHPAIVAQAAATVAEMYGQRFWLAVGSGEALNESITGASWPDKAMRNARLGECVAIMRALWAGETVTHEGHVTVSHAKLYSRPAQPPRLLGAALSVETARWVGSWADGLITVAGAPGSARSRIEAFREGGGEGKPVFLQVALAYGASDDHALRAACDQWRQCGLSRELLADLATVEAFDEAAARVSADEVSAAVRVSADINRQIDWLHEDLRLGVSGLYLHNVVREHDRFLAACAERVLPALGVMSA